MATIGELFVNLKADTSDFEKGMLKSQKTSAQTSQSVRSQVMSLASEYKKQECQVQKL